MSNEYVIILDFFSVKGKYNFCCSEHYKLKPGLNDSVIKWVHIIHLLKKLNIIILLDWH